MRGTVNPRSGGALVEIAAMTNRHTALGALALIISLLSGIGVAHAQKAYDWTGLYIGVNAGHNWHQTDVTYAQGPGIVFGNDLSTEGFIGGGQVGYNLRSGQWVYGVELDVSGLDSKDSSFTQLNIFNTVSITEKLRWLSTIRARLGITTGPALFFISSGLALAGVEQSALQNGVATTVTPVPEQQSIVTLTPEQRVFSRDETKKGWTLGGGVDYALGGAWTLGAEYLYVDLGNSKAPAPLFFTPEGLFVFPATTVKFDDIEHIVRVRLNYRFPG
jgi:outer membrane immunogenic protein